MFEAILLLLLFVPCLIVLYRSKMQLINEKHCLKEELVKALEENKSLNEKINFLHNTEDKWMEAFKSASFDALQKNNHSFISLAEQVFGKYQEKASGIFEKNEAQFIDQIKPIKESLELFNVKINDLEKTRIGAYSSLVDQVKGLFDAQSQLRVETKNLVNALKAPIVRGRWGEIQLKRVVEMAGMLDHCDFFEQESVASEDGRLRPDMVVKLPSSKSIVVDAKAPLSAYLEAIECTNEELRIIKLKEHAKQVKAHITQLSKKAYWDQFKSTPEFVVLFLPGEIFFSAALEQDPSLIEVGVEHKVILATPTTLIAVLRAVAYGWRQEVLSKNAEQISALGFELYKRLCDFGEHFSKVGKNLNQSVAFYNKAVGTLESRVLVTARKFKEMNHVKADDSLDEITPLEMISRPLGSQELAVFNTD